MSGGAVDVPLTGPASQGEIGLTCVPIPWTQCKTLVGESGTPHVYWILQAVKG